MIEVEVGDTIVEFPDGTSKDVMRQALQKRFGSPSAQKPVSQALPAPQGNISPYTGPDQMALDPTQDIAPLTPEQEREASVQRGITQERRLGDLGKELTNLPGIAGDTAEFIQNSALGRFVSGLKNVDLGLQQAVSKALSATGDEDLQVAAEVLDRQIADRDKDIDLGVPGVLGEIVGAAALGGGNIVPSAISGALATPSVQQRDEAFDSVADFAKEKAIQAGVGVALPLGFKGIGKAVDDFISPTIDDATKKLASKAKNLGIDLRIDQIVPTKIRNTAQKVSQQIFGSGVDAFEDTQRAQFNKAVAKTLSKDLEDLSPSSMQKFKKQNSADFDSSLGEKPVNIKKSEVDLLNRQYQNLEQELTPIGFENIKKSLDNILGSIAKDADNLQPVSANKLGALRSRLLNSAVKAKGEEKIPLSEMVEFVDDIVAQNSTPEIVEKLSKARRSYRNFKTIQPLLAESTKGDINPTRLMSEIKRKRKFINPDVVETGADELVDLGRIGRDFLPKKGGSDTFEKTAYGGALVGGATDPITTAAIGGTAIAGNVAFQKGINQNQKLVDRIIKGKRTFGDIPVSSSALASPAAIATGKVRSEGVTDTPAVSPISPEVQSLLDRIKTQTSTTSPADNTPPEPPFENIISNVLEEEGGFVANDAGAGPTKFGINKRANPDVDVKNLTKNQAINIYKKRYWDGIDADNLAPAMQVIAMDAAVNQGVGWTKKALKKAGNDVDKFRDLRKKRYEQIAKNPKKKKYLEGWLKRVDRAYDNALQFI